VNKEVTNYFPGTDVTTTDLTEVEGACSQGGDSGGPWFASNVAYGIHVGTANEYKVCDVNTYYQEITDATEALGVSVAPRFPHVTVTATAHNGNPGWATVKGTVTIPGMTINNKNIDIKLFKWENQDWVLKATLPAKVNNNSYEIQNWHGVGPGSWLARADFPAQEGVGGSSSNVLKEGSFTVKDGYRIVSKSSSKCVDVLGVDKENGASIRQWDCLNPMTSQNQVYTLVPQGGYFSVVARHSGRCLDVIGASQSNGGLLQQWTCNGYPQQLWQLVPTGGEYFELRAKHSGKCMDLTGASQTNGAHIQQWTCNGGVQQKWSFKSVDSGPIPTETGLTVPEGERLNGQPGYATAQGYVKTGAYPIGGNYVNVNYEKEVSPGNFQLIRTQHPTLNNEGFYQWRYEPLAAGNWKIWTGFPGVGNLAASQSPGKVSVELKSGYRLKVRHSDKCLNLWGNLSNNGNPIVQWDCLPNPNPNDGETFTMVPRENGAYYNIEINSTDKCIDVTGAGTGNGVKLQQWDCSSPPVAQQLWQFIPIAGQDPWVAFIAKHSGKCMDVSDVSQSNGAKIHQWDCLWTGNQQWKFMPVN